ncbi:MAG: ferrochelatase [Rhodospirillaceae bacterium]|nr:MAG: ferrochelatase [Rhodospirillaceae bacterium]
MATDRLAIVIFNLGGPDGPAAVRPFLFNLFNDPYIIDLPAPLRWLLAQAISMTRAPKSRRYYAALGGGSPLLAETRAQAVALEAAAASLADTVKVFTFMRYWHPFARETVAEVKAFQPTRVVMLPLYPQFSTSTTATSLAVFAREARRQGLDASVDTICCYPTDDGFVGTVVDKLRAACVNRNDTPRIVFCAHGLPLKTIAAGDPYQWQVESTVAAVVARAAIPGPDWVLSYQSRVGPLEWLGPSVEAEIQRAGRDRKPVVVVPIAFVSEHVETLFELDVTMRDLARESGVPRFERLPTARTDSAFMAGLVELIRCARGRGLCSGRASSGAGGRLCPGTYSKCPVGAADHI